MDTDYLSSETYQATLIEAEQFNHNLTLYFGLLSKKCKNEQEFIEKAEQLLHDFKEAKTKELFDAFFGEGIDIDEFHKTIDKIFKNLEEVKKIPFKKRHFKF